MCSAWSEDHGNVEEKLMDIMVRLIYRLVQLLDGYPVLAAVSDPNRRERPY